MSIKLHILLDFLLDFLHTGISIIEQPWTRLDIAITKRSS